MCVYIYNEDRLECTVVLNLKKVAYSMDSLRERERTFCCCLCFVFGFVVVWGWEGVVVVVVMGGGGGGGGTVSIHGWKAPSEQLNS